MFHIALTASELKSFNAALKDSKRSVRFRCDFLNKNGEELANPPILLDGEVVVDSTSVKTSPTRTAHITLLDPERRYPLDATDSSSGAAWFSKQIRLTYGVWVRDLDKWIDIPVFTGWVYEVARRGIELDIDAQGKEAQHLPPAVFPNAFSIRKGTRVSAAIEEILRKRGENRFSINQTDRRLGRDRTWALGQSPWKAVQNLADSVDKQGFFRGDGTFSLRGYPNTPCWVFDEGSASLLVEDAEERVSRANVVNLVVVKGESKPFKADVLKKTTLASKANAGATSVVVADATAVADKRRIEIGSGDNKEVRTVAPSWTSGTTVPLSSPLANAHPKNAPVKLRWQTKKTEPIFGRAELKQHPLSSQNLTDGKRPQVFIDERPRIHKKANAVEKAEAILDRKRRGLEDEVTVRCIPVPHLEEGDKIAVEVGNKTRYLRIRRFTIPLNVSGLMEINWLGDLQPERGNRGGFANLNETSELGTRDSSGKPEDDNRGRGGGNHRSDNPTLTGDGRDENGMPNTGIGSPGWELPGGGGLPGRGNGGRGGNNGNRDKNGDKPGTGRGDKDKDGIANHKDKDKDGDGIRNKKDKKPGKPKPKGRGK